MHRSAVVLLVLGALLGMSRFEVRGDEPSRPEGVPSDPGSPAKNPRTDGVCDDCREKAEAPAIAVIGPCAYCREGYTPSPVFRACAACAVKRGVCRVCLRPLPDAGQAGSPGVVGAEPGVAAPGPAEIRVPGFCDGCQAKARGPIIESSAQCAVCKDGWTASGMFRACDACAEKRKICKICLKALKGSSPMRPAGEIRPDGAGTKRTIEQVQTTHGDDLMALRGVVGHGIGQEEGRPALILYVLTPKDAKRLDALLADVIEGYPLKIIVSGRVEAK